MDWTRITNNFCSRKKQVQKSVFPENGEIPPERILSEYLACLREEMNYRLFFEMTDTVPETMEEIQVQDFEKKYHAGILLPPGQVLWVESITVTDCKYEACSRQEKHGKKGSLWERIKKRLMGKERKKQSFRFP